MLGRKLLEQRRWIHRGVVVFLGIFRERSLIAFDSFYTSVHPLVVLYPYLVVHLMIGLRDRLLAWQLP